MKTSIKVGDIMTRNFVSVNRDASLIDCAREMIKKRVGSLVIKEGQKIIGLITEKDIIWAMTKKGQKDLGKIKASEVASKKIATIKPGADLTEALQRMKKLKFRRLPVTVNGNIVGLLTLKDILRIQPELFTNFGEMDKIREEQDKIKRLKGGKWIKEGMCEQCGNFDLLYNVDSRLICEPCKESM